MVIRFRTCLFFLLAVTALIPNKSIGFEGTQSCSVTQPASPPFVPPAPYRAVPGPRAFWYGTSGLWTSLPLDGIWHRGGRGYYSNKFFLWQEGYDGLKELRPDIILVLNRLDSKMPLIPLRGGTNAWFDNAWHLLTGIAIPTDGCWEVTAYHAGHTLTFVVSVQP